jgi:glycosyltransferase involved in cell wall biosynthesis
MSKTVWIVNQYASTPEYGYAGRHYYLGRELAKLGYKVYLITSAAHHLLRKKPVFDSQFHFEKEGEFTVVWVKMPEYSEAHSKTRVLGWFLFPWRMRKLVNAIKDAPDVIVCSSPSLISFLGAKRLAKKFQVRLIFEVRDIWPMTLTEIGGHSPTHPLIRLMQWVEDRAYRDSDRVISNLKNSVAHMFNRGMDRSKFAWIPNGFSLEEIGMRVPLNSEVCSQLPENKFVVGYTGTIGVANALDTLVEAAELLKAYPEIAFVIVGRGKEKGALLDLVKSKNLESVHFVDSIPKVEVQAMLSQFDACYLGWLDDPIYQFGIGANKIPEYLFSGKPVLHAYSGSGDPVKEAGAGISVPAEDPEKLAAAVLKLHQMTPEELKELGDDGHSSAMARYEYGRLARQFRDILFPEDSL